MIYYVFGRYGPVHRNKDVNLIIKSGVDAGHQITLVSETHHESFAHGWMSLASFKEVVLSKLVTQDDIVFLYHLGDEASSQLAKILASVSQKNLPKIYIKCDFSGYLPFKACPSPLNDIKSRVRWLISKFCHHRRYSTLFSRIKEARATLIFECEEQQEIFESYVVRNLPSIVQPNPNLSKKSDVGNREFDFIAVGNWSLARQKNPSLLLQILQRLQSQYRCLVIGKGATSIFEALDVEAHDMLSNEEVQSFMSRSKALICTSRFEGFPNIFLEAVASETKIISTEFSASRAMRRLGVAFVSSSLSEIPHSNEFKTFFDTKQNFKEAQAYFDENYWKNLV